MHRKLDIIQRNGTGIGNINNESNAPLTSSFRNSKNAPLQVRNPSRGHQEQELLINNMLKKQQFKGSLNFLRRKKEAERVDYENLKMAKRIVTQDSCVFRNLHTNRDHPN